MGGWLEANLAKGHEEGSPDDSFCTKKGERGAEK